METKTMQPQRLEWFMDLYKSKNILSKKKWAPEAMLNTAIEKCVWSDEKNHWLYLTTSDIPYSNFVSKFVNDYVDAPFEIANAFIPYEQILYVPKDVNQTMAKLPMAGDVIKIKTDDFEISFVPYQNGVMIYGLCVNNKKRNKGIGTKIINYLYDLSEELDIPLFLTPYPDENCDKSEIWDRMNKLKNWYTKLGFGEFAGIWWLMTNYEDNHIEKHLNKALK